MTIKQFHQTDPQWKANLPGFEKTSAIGNDGYLLTSLTMCATHYCASDLTPAKAVGGLLSPACNIDLSPTGWGVIFPVSLPQQSGGFACPVIALS